MKVVLKIRVLNEEFETVGDSYQLAVDMPKGCGRDFANDAIKYGSDMFEKIATELWVASTEGRAPIITKEQIGR